MPEPVPDAQIASLTRRYAAARHRRTTVLAELGRDRVEIDRFTAALTRFEADGSTASQVPYLPDGYPAAARLKGMLTDLRDAMTELDQVRDELKQAGIDLP